MDPSFLKLDWDSDFFGFNVCRWKKPITSVEDLNAIEKVMTDQHISLAYYSSFDEMKIKSNDTLDIKLVDKKVTYVKKCDDSRVFHPMVSVYDKDFPNSKLFDLAIECGVYSRFNIDKRIGTKKYEELYRQWIINSVTKKIAKEVLVYIQDDEIAGYLTIGEKNSRADLGMASVDSKFRGKGIGFKLFTSAEKWAVDHGYTDIQIVTQGDNLPACKLYEKLGYQSESLEFFYHIWKKAYL